MFKTFINNLSKKQRIVFLVIIQVIIILFLALLVKSFTGERQHINIENEAEFSKDMPAEAESFIKDNIWQIIKSKIVGADRNDVDIVIREGTYKETETDDGVSVEFIVDIDSLEQTFKVKTGWSKDKNVIYEVIVDCPSQNEMKYPNTICYGAYNNTYSLDLYLPYTVYPEGYEDDGITAPNYMISGDESSKTLNILVSSCNEQGFKEAAWNYLNTLPIDFSDYKINYEVNNVDVRC